MPPYIDHRVHFVGFRALELIIYTFPPQSLTSDLRLARLAEMRFSQSTWLD